MRRYPKKTKIEEKMELSYRYQLVMRYAWSTGPLYEAPDDETVQVMMPWSLKKGLTVLLDGDAMSACSIEHAEMIVANPAKQFPPRSCIEDAASEIALRIRFDLDRWIERFDAIWPAGSPAAVSYRRRIVAGPPFTVDHALGREVVACPV
jgi:hypothetical protein